MKSAAIFDVDGVLVDSFDAHLDSWQQLAAETGISFTRQDFIATFGRTSRDILATYWPVDAADHDRIRSLDHRKEQIYRDIVMEHFPVMGGARELINDLHGSGFLIALGSSGPAENIQLALDRLAIQHLIHATVTGEDVKRGKPDPEVFLTAAQRLGIASNRCVVIEDAPAGVIAAHKGGMKAVAMLGRGHTKDDFAHHAPDMFVASLRELNPSILLNLIDDPQT